MICERSPKAVKRGGAGGRIRTGKGLRPETPSSATVPHGECRSTNRQSCYPNRAVRTPTGAIAFMAAWSILLALSGTYGQLLDSVVFGLDLLRVDRSQPLPL